MEKLLLHRKIVFTFENWVNKLFFFQIFILFFHLRVRYPNASVVGVRYYFFSLTFSIKQFLDRYTQPLFDVHNATHKNRRACL